MNKPNFWIIIPLITILNSSCIQSVSLPEAGLPSGSNMRIKPTRAVDDTYWPLIMIIASDKLIGYIAPVNPRINHTGAFAKAQVTLQNLTENRYTLEYQFQWQDDQQFLISEPRPWQRFLLGPKEAKIIQEMALHPNATRAIFTVRLPDDSVIEFNKQIQKKLRNTR